MDNKGKPITQEWFDENRQLFDAETTQYEPQETRCPHDGFLFRTPNNEVQCQCGAGWINLPINIVNGKITP